MNVHEDVSRERISLFRKASPESRQTFVRDEGEGGGDAAASAAQAHLAPHVLLTMLFSSVILLTRRFCLYNKAK